MINNSDPIIPGKSAAGIMLGDDISKIIEFNVNYEMDDHGICILYTFESTSLWVEDAKVVQISVFNNYRGRIDEKVGINSLIKDIVNNYGEISEGDSDNLIAVNSPGWSFETDDWNTDYSNDLHIDKNLEIPVTEIFVQPI